MVPVPTSPDPTAPRTVYSFCLVCLSSGCSLAVRPCPRPALASFLAASWTRSLRPHLGALELVAAAQVTAPTSARLESTPPREALHACDPARDLSETPWSPEHRTKSCVSEPGPCPSSSGQVFMASGGHPSLQVDRPPSNDTRVKERLFEVLIHEERCIT